MSEENTSEENTSEEDITALIAALKSKYSWRRFAAATTLGVRKAPQAVPALIEALQDRSIAWVVADALGAIGDSQALPSLLQAFKAEESDLTLRHAAKALGMIGGPEVVPPLLEALQNRRTDRLAAEALGAIGDPQAAPALIEILTDEDGDWLVRSKAAEALGMIGGPEVVPSLIEALKDRCTSWNAAEGLTKIGLPVVPALINIGTEYANTDKGPFAYDCLKSSHELHFAHKVLEAIEDPQAVPALIMALGIKDFRVGANWETINALAKTDVPAVPALIEVFQNKNEHWTLRFVVAEVIGRIGSPQAIPALIQAMEDEDEDWQLSRKAASTLKKMAQHHPCPALRSALPTLRRLRKRHFIYREAAEQIKAATAAFDNLPMPAAAPPPDAQALPRSAAAPLGDLVMPPQGLWTRLRRRLKGF